MSKTNINQIKYPYKFCVHNKLNEVNKIFSDEKKNVGNLSAR